MKFSIIVPFYNDISDIHRLFVTLKDYINSDVCEIIIVDDCSRIKDFIALKIYIDEIKADNICLIRNEKNCGAAFSRQQGVEIAKGEFITFLDADDGWIKNRAFILYDYVIYHSVNIIGGATVSIDEKKFQDLRNVDFKLSPPKGLNFKKFLFKNYFSTPTVMVRKDIFLQHGFDTSMRYSEDFECWRRIAMDGRVFFLKNAGTYSFKHAFISQQYSSLSSNSLKMSKGELEGLAKLFKNNTIGFLSKLLIIVALIYSFTKAVIREIRVKIKL